MKPLILASVTVCAVGATTSAQRPGDVVSRVPPLAISSFSVNDAQPALTFDDNMKLYFTTTGPTPTEFRASETSNVFPDAGWRRLEAKVDAKGRYVEYPGIHGARFNQPAASKTIYLQMRGAGQTSEIVRAAVALHSKWTAFAGDVYDMAITRGFMFDAKPIGCTVTPRVSVFTGRRAIMLGTASPVQTPATCVYQLFTGRRLKEGWKVIGHTEQRVGKCGTVWAPPMEGGTLTSGLQLRIEASQLVPGATPCEFQVLDIKLLGPYNDRWEKALER